MPDELPVGPYTYGDKKSILDSLRNFLVRAFQLMMSLLDRMKITLIGGVEVVKALLVILALILIWYVVVFLRHLFTIRYTRHNTTKVGEYNRKYKENLIRSMKEVYMGFTTVRDYQGLVDADPNLMTCANDFVNAVDNATATIQRAVNSPDVAKFASMLMKSSGESGFDVPAIDPNTTGKPVAMAIVKGESMNANSYVLHFVVEALEQEYLESINKDFRSGSKLCTLNVWSELYQVSPPSDGAYSSPIDVLKGGSAPNLSVFGKVLSKYVALASLVKNGDPTAFMQFGGKRFFSLGDASNKIFDALKSKSADDYLQLFLEKKIDSFLTKIDVELAGKGLSRLKTLKEVLYTGEAPVLIVLSEEERTLIRNLVLTSQVKGVDAVLANLGVKINRGDYYELLEMSVLYNNFDTIRNMLDKCKDLRSNIEEHCPQKLDKALDAFAKLKVNCGVASLFTTDYDFPPTLRNYRPRNVLKFYVNAIKNSWIDYGKNVGKMWTDMGRKMVEGFKHYPEMARKWANKYKPRIKGGPLTGVLRLSPLYKGEGFINKIGGFFKAIPKGISKGIGKIFGPLINVFKAIGKFFAKTLPHFIVNFHNFVLGLLILIIWVILFVVLMVLSPVLLFIADFVLPVTLALFISAVGLVVYLFTTILMLLVGVLDVIIFQGSLAYVGRKMFSCHRIPTDWFDTKYAHVGNYFRRVKVGAMCLGCITPCKGTSVPLSDGYGHVTCLKKNDDRVKGQKEFVFSAAMMRLYYNLPVSTANVTYQSIEESNHTWLGNTICGYSDFLAAKFGGSNMDDMCIPASCKDGTNPICARYLGVRYGNPFKFNLDFIEYGPDNAMMVLFILSLVLAISHITFFMIKNKSRQIV